MEVTLRKFFGAIALSFILAPAAQADQIATPMKSGVGQASQLLVVTERKKRMSKFCRHVFRCRQSDDNWSTCMRRLGYRNPKDTGWVCDRDPSAPGPRRG
jgi:hypothetical protein